MRTVFATAVMLGLTITGAVSAQGPQTQAPWAVAQSSGLAGPDNATPPPVAGANSFAESQAKKLIESKGYENVSPLVNDSQGIWHGTATKGDAKVDVSVDYKGHVNAR